MVPFYPQIAKVRVKRYRIADQTADGILIHLKVMLTAFGLLNIQDFQGVPLYDNLGLQRMTLFFPE
jgi:hypothetical protein